MFVKMIYAASFLVKLYPAAPPIISVPTAPAPNITDFVLYA